MMTSSQIEEKLNEIESDMERLLVENRRLIQEREGAYVELDICVSLIVKLAQKNGWEVGRAPGNFVVVELPSGQVSFEHGLDEAHLFAEFPLYEKPIEEITVHEKYARVMNPGL